MPLLVLNGQFEPKSIALAGHYALDVSWEDGHGSLLPFRDLRAACPCASCTGGARVAPDGGDPRARTPIELERVEASLRIVWEDDHETRFTFRQLRELCRCAVCAGEVGPVEAFLGRPNK